MANRGADRIAHLQATKAALRYWKYSTASPHATLNLTRSQGRSQSTEDSNSRDRNQYMVSLNRNGLPLASSSTVTSRCSDLVPLSDSNRYLVSWDSVNSEMYRFTMAEPLQSTPRRENIRILELEDSWKYWIPTAPVKKSPEDIEVKFSDASSLPKVINLTQHAHSSFSVTDMLKFCQKFDSVPHEECSEEHRRLPKELQEVLQRTSSPESVRNQVESHLTPPRDPSEVLDGIQNQNYSGISSKNCSQQPEGPTNSADDCIFLFKSLPTNNLFTNSLTNQTQQRSLASSNNQGAATPGRLSIIANWISSQISFFHQPEFEPDFSNFSEDIVFTYVKSPESRKQLCSNLKQCKQVTNSWRLWMVSTKLEVTSSILKLTIENEKKKICVRWRVKTLSPFAPFSVFVGRRPSDNFKYIDFYSEFLVDDQSGLVYSHVLSKITPSQSGLTDGGKLVTAMGMAIFGLTGGNYDNFSEHLTSSTSSLAALNLEVARVDHKRNNDDQ